MFRMSDAMHVSRLYDRSRCCTFTRLNNLRANNTSTNLTAVTHFYHWLHSSISGCIQTKQHNFIIGIENAKDVSSWSKLFLLNFLTKFYAYVAGQNRLYTKHWCSV